MIYRPIVIDLDITIAKTKQNKKTETDIWAWVMNKIMTTANYDHWHKRSLRVECRTPIYWVM